MNDQHIETALGKVRAIYVKASERIEALNKGEKIPATTLAKELAVEFGTTGPALYPVLKILFDDYPGIVIKKGAQGGLEKQ